MKNLLIKNFPPLLFIFIAFALGVFVRKIMPISSGYLFLMFITLIVFSFFMTRFPGVLSILILCLALISGMLAVLNQTTISRYDIVHQAKYYHSKNVFIKGIVISEPEKQKFFDSHKTNFNIAAKEIKTKWGWRQVEGKVLVNFYAPQEIFYGDYLLLEGKLHYPFNFAIQKNFSYREYLERKSIRLILSVSKKNQVELLAKNRGNYLISASLALKDKCRTLLAKYLSFNEYSLMQGILLGDRTLIPKHINELFIRTGTVHILAISGLNIGIVAIVFLLLLKLIPIGRRNQFIATIILLVFYSFLTGNSPSVVRATIMAVIFLGGFILEKESNVLNALSLSGVLILMFNPLTLFDVGFQLSFVCVFTMLLLSPILDKATQNYLQLTNKKLKHWIIQPFNISLSIWLTTLGLIAYYFHLITPITILVNILVVPLSSLIVALGFGLLIFGALWPLAATAFAMCLKFSLNLMVGIIYLFDKIPGGSIYLSDINVWHIIAWYLLVFVLFRIIYLLSL